MKTVRVGIYAASFLAGCLVGVRINRTKRKQVSAIPKGVHYGVRDLVINNYFTAEDILTALKEVSDKYGKVSVADYYELMSTPSNIVDHSYGWGCDAISSTQVVQVHGGYAIKLPPVESL